MFKWSIRLTWCSYIDNEDFEFVNFDKNESDYKSKHYYVYANNDIDALDMALTLFLNEFNLNFDNDIENIEWGYCRV
jgi:hypothetical protein